MGGGFIASAALSTYAFAIEPLHRQRLKTYRFTPPNWTAGLTPRVALIADVHACKPWMTIDRIEDIVARANDLAPDLTLLLGNYSAGMNLMTDYVHSRDWVPALGNHDWWEDKTVQRAGHGPTFGQLALQKEGIPVLENDAVRLLKDDKAFWIAGLGDQLAFLPHARNGRRRWQGMDDLDGTLAKIADAAPVLLMAHEPDIFPTIPDHVSVTLSGHTHGGQVRLFGYSPVVPSRYKNRYAYGHVVESGRHLIVSGGLGFSIAPIRFGSPPEIVLIELGENAAV
jgi:predicted MPP superfamily phosphohydrolase